jgi:hypothetical protein
MDNQDIENSTPTDPPFIPQLPYVYKNQNFKLIY